jgi:hypothetical protein
MTKAPEIDDILNGVEASASGKITSSSTLDELKTAAELYSVVADSRKTNAEAKHYGRYLRLEGLKSASSFLIPIVSLLTLFATVLIQSYQLKESRQESEDKEWRELLVAIKASVKDETPDVTIAPRIKSFFGSAKYQKQANEVTKRILGQLTFEPGFRDLFEAVFGTAPTLDGIADTADIARTLFVTQNSIEARCLSESSDFVSNVALADFGVRYFGLCSRNIPDSEFAKLVTSLKNADKLIQARRTYLEVVKEQYYVRDRIISVLREHYSKGKTNAAKIDLSRMALVGGDLSGVDFSNFDLSGSILDFINFDGAILTPYRGANSVQLWDSAWWKVEKIDQDLLQSSIAKTFPYYAPRVTYPGGDAPERAYYASRVKALCTPAQESCLEEKLKFGERK